MQRREREDLGAFLGKNEGRSCAERPPTEHTGLGDRSFVDGHNECLESVWIEEGAAVT